jgi:hypothetical protein
MLGTAGCAQGASALASAKAALDSIMPPAPLPPLIQNTTSLQTAMRQGTLGVGYSGSG